MSIYVMQYAYACVLLVAYTCTVRTNAYVAMCSRMVAMHIICVCMWYVNLYGVDKVFTLST